MAFDLAISEHGDLVFGSNRDLAGISGIDLIEQRIRMRLRIMRGSWVYDEDETLGSRLHLVSNLPPNQLETTTKAYVNEALLDMEEIDVTNVEVRITSQDATLVVFYMVNEGSDLEPLAQELQESVPLQLGSTVTTEV